GSWRGGPGRGAGSGCGSARPRSPPPPSPSCYLIASMGLQALWILGLACLDGYVLKVKRDLNNAILVSLFVVGDW
ncbi:hypothetical protein CFC21_053881, partial [Triticum aestivum]